ncbi:hypothetical protein EJ05DRAFT_173497 [Pseudovirgaria hyperparasitica]|uniref:Uncharacterized protein n=1 Tax=Pseudovirgaria hyperparasitica TaxID=470096 RepID=A0A6A6WHE3_9PEZI|nr:uncharacterized protein EJ05DRAFT_173497 [Pseudovirgaria hyperparasitica]KAF2761490.1 hypothetical protein EJ05DRAFT_173497 [Pseudovirgaria hyperparasitica]
MYTQKQDQPQSDEATLFGMATPPTSLRVGVNFPSSEQSHLTIGDYATVDPSDIIVKEWYLVRTDIVDILKQLPWAVLSVVRGHHYSLEPQFSATTILGKNAVVLVGAPVESHASWQPMAEHIYSLCAHAGLGHVRIMFEPVPYPLTALNQDLFEPPASQLPEEGQVQQTVPMGSSFGPVGERESTASVGGTIKLQDKGKEPEPFLLSVFHPFDSLVSEQERLHGYRRNTAQPIQVRIPSPQDTDIANVWNTNRINTLEGRLKVMDGKFKLLGDEKFQTQAVQLEELIKGHQEDLRKLHDATNRLPGILYYGSGFGRATDWSLSLFEDRILQNKPPSMKKITDSIRNHHVDSIDFKRLGEEFMDAATVSAFARPEIDGLAVMEGRTSGLTLGKVNALESDIIIMKSLKVKKGLSFEVRAILSGKGKPAVQPGDSGAWFVNMKGEWIGSVVGTHSGLRSSIGLVLEAEKIVEDIEAFTGSKVVSPVRSEVPGAV